MWTPLCSHHVTCIQDASMTICRIKSEYIYPEYYIVIDRGNIMSAILQYSMCRVKAYLETQLSQHGYTGIPGLQQALSLIT